MSTTIDSTRNASAEVDYSSEPVTVDDSIPGSATDASVEVAVNGSDSPADVQPPTRGGVDVNSTDRDHPDSTEADMLQERGVADSIPASLSDESVTLATPAKTDGDIHQDGGLHSAADGDGASSGQPEQQDASTSAADDGLPDSASISVRLRKLVVAVGQVEELSRRAREAAAGDLTLYNGIAASQRQFEEGLAEAQRIGQEAREVYQHAFGREAKAVAEPAVMEAREVEQAFTELADAWRLQAESFLSQHPDVESLLAERRLQEDEARRREIAREKAERFQQLVNGADAALRQGLLDDARDCLSMLGAEFPAQKDRVRPLHDRVQQQTRASNDAAARRVLVEASELQARGEFNAAVRLLEAVDVQGLSREASEDVFGRWSAACSLLAQTGGLELLRYSPTQGKGIILHSDPSVPYGLVEFSSLGMGPSHVEGTIVSKADRGGAVIVSRARPFRAAELPAETSFAWYGRSYVTPGGSTSEPARH